MGRFLHTIWYLYVLSFLNRSEFRAKAFAPGHLVEKDLGEIPGRRTNPQGKIKLTPLYAKIEIVNLSLSLSFFAV